MAVNDNFQVENLTKNIYDIFLDRLRDIKDKIPAKTTIKKKLGVGAHKLYETCKENKGALSGGLTTGITSFSYALTIAGNYDTITDFALFGLSIVPTFVGCYLDGRNKEQKSI